MRIKSNTKVTLALVALILIAPGANTLFAQCGDKLQQARVEKRIQFARGRSTTSVRGTIGTGEIDRYIVSARAGQRISLRIVSPQNNAAFDVFPSDCSASLMRGQSTQQHWAGKLPNTGDYFIEIARNTGAANYKLLITIK